MMDVKEAGIFVQNSCLQHKYIRTKDLSAIVERPERLRAVNIGLSAAIARLDALLLAGKQTTAQSHLAKDETDPNDLAQHMTKLSLSQSAPKSGAPLPVTITNSEATVDLLNHPAVKFIHGDIEGDVYLKNLKRWASESIDKIKNGMSEIPDNYFQGDLYRTYPYHTLYYELGLTKPVCPGSMNAIQGAIGTVCEAVDKVISSTRSTDNKEPLHRAFVAVRPPGHHCGEDTPSGFCFVNNVAVGAAHGTSSSPHSCQLADSRQRT
jgi:histone deacetylase HOS3